MSSQWTPEDFQDAKPVHTLYATSTPIFRVIALTYVHTLCTFNYMTTLKPFSNWPHFATSIGTISTLLASRNG